MKLLEHRTDDKGFSSSVVELTPITGRTHQLRVHMRHCGHTILGDTMYASGADLEMSHRLLLHAYSLEIEHPCTGKRMRFTAECPFVPSVGEEVEASSTGDDCVRIDSSDAKGLEASCGQTGEEEKPKALA